MDLLSKPCLEAKVIANIPTYFDKGTSNNIETYSLDETGAPSSLLKTSQEEHLDI